MARFYLTLLAILAVANAFTTPKPVRSVSKPLFMFSAEDGKASAEASKALSEVSAGESADALQEITTLEASTTEMAAPEKPKMTVLNRNTGELVEVEMNESFLANEKFEMNWWAWIGFVAFPVVLLSNDVLHFLPKDGPLGFLGNL